MKTLDTIYWLRFAFGIIAAFLCIGYGAVSGIIFESEITIIYFVNGLSIAIITYLASYYIIRYRFFERVEKPQKLVTTGIGIYFISWVVIWTLVYTIIAGPNLSVTASV
ncbi:MAG: hypothetical protein PVF96_03680 [Candidatus Bathyarchaeota archaeon]|jgi:hypothetical protein